MSKPKDKTGNRYGKLTVIEFDHTKNGRTYWKLKCDCGNEIIRRVDNLTDHSSCGCYTHDLMVKNNPNKINLIGEKFGRLTVVKQIKERNKFGGVQWECKCDCGNTTVVPTGRLQSGITKSCGCLKRDIIIETGRKNRIKYEYMQEIGPYGIRFLEYTDDYISPKGKRMSKAKFLCTCGRTFEATVSFIKRGHTKSCNAKIHRVGENGPNWQGDKTSKLMLERNSLDYINWRDSIFKRDDHVCQKCRQRGGKLQAHHIYNFADHPDVRFDVDNGVTLCKQCHLDLHKKYGWKSDLNDYLDFIEETETAFIPQTHQIELNIFKN